MKKFKIGAGIIIRNEAERLYDNLVMLSPFCEVICVVDTGSDDNPSDQVDKFTRLHPELAKVIFMDKRKYVAEEIDGKWLITDFARARNYYLKVLKSQGCDYCWTWSIGNVFKFNPTRQMFQSLIKEKPKAELIYVRVFRATVSVWHPRLIKLKGASKVWGYRDKVHEYIEHAQDDSRCYFVQNAEFYIDHPAGNMPSQELSRDRNFRILKKVYGTSASSPRNNFYYAWALSDKQMYQEAIEVAGRTIVDNSKDLNKSYLNDLAYLILKSANIIGFDLTKRLEMGEVFSKTFKEYSPVLVEYSKALIEAGKLVDAAYAAFAAVQPIKPQIFQHDSDYNETPIKLLDAIHRKMCEDESITRGEK